MTWAVCFHLDVNINLTYLIALKPSGNDIPIKGKNSMRQVNEFFYNFTVWERE